MVTADSFIRPSSLERLALCPGSAILEAAVVNAFGQPGESDEASAGTAIHNAAAEAIVDWREGVDWGRAIADSCNKAQAAGMDRWSVRCIQLCAEFARDLIEKHKIERDHVLVEHRLDMAAFGFARGGTADLILVIPFRCVFVVDWKAGNLDQGDADEHDQATAYACAAAATFKCSEVMVYLYQPRMERDRRATAAKFDARALRSNSEWTAGITAAARDPRSELCASYSACKYCKALSRCAVAKEMIVNAQEALQYIGNPTDPDAWGEALSAAKLGESLHKAVIGSGDAPGIARIHLNAGGKATGFALQSGGAMTKIDAPKAIAIAKENGFLDELLEFASIKAEASKVLEISDATSSIQKAASIKAVKGGAAA